MKIWFDGQCFQTASRNRGIGRYCAELVAALRKANPDIEMCVSFNAALADLALATRPSFENLFGADNLYMWQGLAQEGEVESGYNSKRKLSELALVHHVNCVRPDIAISPSPLEGQHDPAVPLLPNQALEIPTIGLFYDAIPLSYPERYLPTARHRNYYRRRLDHYAGFDHVMCISEFSKNQLDELVTVKSSSNISAGVSPSLINRLAMPSLLADARLVKGYVLYVGALDWRKNVSLIPQAMACLPDEHRLSIPFVLAGDHPPSLVDELREQWISLSLPADLFVSMGLINDQMLADLYRGASVLVQPSFMEGFGLTALEAMTCGTPVLVANAGALPEVVGDANQLFDPNSPDDLADKLARLLSSKDQKGLVDTALKQAETFTWERSESLAARAISEFARAPEKQETPLDARRRALVRQLQEINEPAALKASILAAAEIPPVDSPRVIIDATSTINSKFSSGIQRVVRKICDQSEAMGQFAGQDIYVSYCDDFDGIFGARENWMSAQEKRPDQRLIPARNDLFLALDSSWEYHQEHAQVFLEARLRGATVISCLYDTVPIRSSAFCDRNLVAVFVVWLNMALSYSTGFVCISKAVADELLAILRAMEFPRPIDIGYWHLGADFSDRKALETKVEPTPRSMFLLVGTIEPRKGHRVALTAFEKLWREGHDINLVFAGRYGWGAHDFVERLGNHPEFGRRLIWKNDVSDEELQQLYANCTALIAASFAEGFGLPIVEAGHFDRPVIASDIPVFREVAAGAKGALFFETGNADALAERVEALLDTGLPESEDAGMDNWPGWDESTQQLLDVVVNGKWYERYEPAENPSLVSEKDTGFNPMERVVADEDRAFRLTVISPVRPSDYSGILQVVVAVTNESQAVWPGVSTYPEQPVGVSFHVLDAAGEILKYENERSHFPMLVTPGDTQYLSLWIPANWIEKGATHIEIEMLQERVAWWGGAITLPINPGARIMDKIPDLDWLLDLSADDGELVG
ncbi:glycosyltransferase family 1 protein [Hyphomonas sp.]|jgi:glycosyltransferase involved in cell wall biosynthesis|uniref:glycosyltransferase family 4 protein n=1 Tax=Hyphomonas sp. TaxID=87 RepID=UPI0032D92876